MSAKHRQSKWPAFCQRWSAREKRWLWGFRYVTFPDGVRREDHVHGYETLAEAQAALRELKDLNKSRAGLPVGEPLLSKLVAAYLRTASDQRRAKRVLTTWLSLLPNGLRVRAVDVPHLQAYVEQRTADGLQGSSIDRELNIIVACLNYARVEYAELRQWRIPPVPRPKFSKNSTRQTVTPEQYQRLHDWFLAQRQDGEQLQSVRARHRTGRFFRFMMLTGCRTSEACAFEVGDIERQYGRIRIVGKKTELKRDSVRYLPLTAEIDEVLTAQIEANQVERQTLRERECPKVFTTGKNIPPTFYEQWGAACKALGIPHGKSVGFTFYSARHTFVSDMLFEGEDIVAVGELVGHSDVRITKHYAKTSPAALRRAAETMSNRAFNRLQKFHNGVAKDAENSEIANEARDSEKK